ncbi:hypothetical protein POPTR_019G090950v4 [Populus trichocarpa]|uniref:Uncharacterized protein n=1 Tax=Populus trichocarpa TaxID=3694 RepID=A0ACC0RK59_POPTR|nr:hypothetical protein BDE02_19G086100 [Populus trichocarpa]KAI9377658.1 hypothetical protein POPTR_019G090950v4 [Populus trichocarpa]
MSGSNSYVANRSTQETRVTTKQICLIGIFFLLPGNGPSRVFLASNSRLETGQTPRCRDEIVDNTPHMLMVHHVQDCPLSCLNSEVLLLAGSDLSIFNGRGKQWGVFFSFFC